MNDVKRKLDCTEDDETKGQQKSKRIRKKKRFLQRMCNQHSPGGSDVNRGRHCVTNSLVCITHEEVNEKSLGEWITPRR